MASTTFTGPVTSQNGFISGSGSLVSQTVSSTVSGSGAVTVTSANLAGRMALMNGASTANGSLTYTLPAATGTGNTYTFVVGATATGTGTYVIKVKNSTDVMAGRAYTLQDNAGDTIVGFETAADSDTITLNGTTTGGTKGDIVTITDIGSGLFLVKCDLTGTGTEATPFSATV
jgi:hypothetical protein